MYNRGKVTYFCINKTNLCLGPVSLKVLKKRNRHRYSQTVNGKERHAVCIATFSRFPLQVPLCPCTVYLSMKTTMSTYQILKSGRNIMVKRTQIFLNKNIQLEWECFRVSVAWNTHPPGPGATVPSMGAGLVPSGISSPKIPTQVALMSARKK